MRTNIIYIMRNAVWIQTSCCFQKKTPILTGLLNLYFSAK